MVDVCYPEGTDWSCAYTPEELEALDPDVVDRSNALAWSVLSALTGYRVSLCPVMIRPCAQRCGLRTWDIAPVSDGNFSLWGTGGPYISGGNWYNACGCAGPSDCSCSRICEVILPEEVGAIMGVELDGVLLDPAAYRVDNGIKLVRQDGECWPASQDMSKPVAEGEDGEGTFAVFYYPGVAPNDLLRYAAGVLATEFYLSCTGKDCRLPNGVTNITRSGVVMELPTGIFLGNSTGIPEVDAVIRIYNPYSIKSRPRVMSPDRTRGRTQTWSV